MIFSFCALNRFVFCSRDKTLKQQKKTYFNENRNCLFTTT